MHALESVKFDEDPLLPSVKYRQSLIKSLFYKVTTCNMSLISNSLDVAAVVVILI